jgi:hypothetical protein
MQQKKEEYLDKDSYYSSYYLIKTEQGFYYVPTNNPRSYVSAKKISKLNLDLSTEFHFISKLQVGDWISVDNTAFVKPCVTSQYIDISKYLINQYDLCYSLDNPKLKIYASKVFKEYELETPEKLSLVSAYGTLSPQVLYRGLQLTKTIKLKNNLLISPEFLFLAYKCLASEFTLTAGKYLEIVDLTTEEKHFIFNYFKKLGYVNSYRENSYLKDSSVIITSKLFIQLFSTLFNNFEFISSLTVSKFKLFLSYLKNSKSSFFYLLASQSKAVYNLQSSFLKHDSVLCEEDISSGFLLYLNPKYTYLKTNTESTYFSEILDIKYVSTEIIFP